MKEYEALKPYAKNDHHRRAIDAVVKHGSIAKAAKALGTDNRNFRRLLSRIKEYAAGQGWSPQHNMEIAVPDTHIARWVSSRYKVDEDGNRRLVEQKVAANIKAADTELLLREVASELGEELKGRAWQVPVRRGVAIKDLLTVYPLADPHLGMLSWREETGEDYDHKIGRELIENAADRLVAGAADSYRCVIANLGDFFHFDNDDKRTRRSGNVLDGDGRWSKIVRVGVHALKYFIAKALTKHKEVHVVNSIGNHDEQTALMLAMILEPFYENEPRVTIEMAPRSFHYYRFGSNLLGFHHGHQTPMKELPGLMSVDKRKEWGECEYCMWLTGHVHHESKEYVGCLVESFRTLAAKDAWHASEGYRALRDIQALTFHERFGEIGRQRVSLKMMKANGI